MTPCLDEDAILSFCRGNMAPESRKGVLEHIAECDECRALVSAVARSSLIEPKEVVVDPAMAPTTPAQGLGSGPGPSGAVNAPVQPGDVLAGKYAVERVLGAGGMGVVVAARHTQLGQLVALKFLLPAACEAPGAIARFLREGKAAARITSEHVARVVDTGVLENGSPYLVMEYLEGTDLAALTADRGPLPVPEAIDYVLQACEAVVEAHQLGIVHRDLKPANLFLSRRKDGSALVKVLDFGISKSEGSSRSQLTSTSTLMGSPRYMSPEQMVSAKDVDHRTDIWALGVVLFELVTGKPVWHADTVQGLCALIASVPAPRLGQLVPDAPPALEDVVARCLAKSAEQRIPTVADLALALAPVAPEASRTSIDRILGVARRPLASTPAWSRPPAVVPTAPPSSSRRTVFLIAAMIGALVAGVAFSLLLVPRLHRSPHTSGIAGDRVPAAATAAAPPATPPASSAAVAEPAPAPTPLPVAAAPLPVPAAAPPAAKAARTSRPRTPPASSTEAQRTAPAVDPPTPAPHPAAPDGPNRALSDRK